MLDKSLKLAELHAKIDCKKWLKWLLRAMAKSDCKKRLQIVIAKGKGIAKQLHIEKWLQIACDCKFAVMNIFKILFIPTCQVATMCTMSLTKIF